MVMQTLSMLQADTLRTGITCFLRSLLFLALPGFVGRCLVLSDGLNDMGCSSSAEQGLFLYILSFCSYGERSEGLLSLKMKHIEWMCDFGCLISGRRILGYRC